MFTRLHINSPQCIGVARIFRVIYVTCARLIGAAAQSYFSDTPGPFLKYRINHTKKAPKMDPPT